MKATCHEDPCGAEHSLGEREGEGHGLPAVRVMACARLTVPLTFMTSIGRRDGPSPSRNEYTGAWRSLEASAKPLRLEQELKPGQSDLQTSP